GYLCCRTQESMGTTAQGLHRCGHYRRRRGTHYLLAPDWRCALRYMSSKAAGEKDSSLETREPGRTVSLEEHRCKKSQLILSSKRCQVISSALRRRSGV